MENDQNPLKGFKIQEIEHKVKENGLEISLCTMFVLTAIFTLVWGGSMLLWSILLSMILGVIGILFPKQVKRALHSSMEFAFKEKATKTALAVIGVVVSILIPAAMFALVGLLAGKSIVMHASSSCDNCESDK